MDADPTDQEVLIKIQNEHFDTCHNCTDFVPTGYSALVYCVNNTVKWQRQYCLSNGVWSDRKVLHRGSKLAMSFFSRLYVQNEAF